MNRPSDDEMAMLIERTAALLGLSIAPHLLGGVCANMHILIDHASRVMAVLLPTDTGAATEFQP